MRTRCSFAPTARSSAATAAACRCRGPATRRPRSGSRRRLRQRRGCRSRATGASTRSSARLPIPNSMLAWYRTLLAHRHLLSGKLTVGRDRSPRVPGLRTRRCAGHHQRRRRCRRPARPTWSQGRSVILATQPETTLHEPAVRHLRVVVACSLRAILRRTRRVHVSTVHDRAASARQPLTEPASNPRTK